MSDGQLVQMVIMSVVATALSVWMVVAVKIREDRKHDRE